MKQDWRSTRAAGAAHLLVFRVLQDLAQPLHLVTEVVLLLERVHPLLEVNLQPLVALGEQLVHGGGQPGVVLLVHFQPLAQPGQLARLFLHGVFQLEQETQLVGSQSAVTRSPTKHGILTLGMSGVNKYIGSKKHLQSYPPCSKA